MCGYHIKTLRIKNELETNQEINLRRKKIKSKRKTLAHNLDNEVVQFYICSVHNYFIIFFFFLNSRR